MDTDKISAQLQEMLTSHLSIVSAVGLMAEIKILRSVQDKPAALTQLINAKVEKLKDLLNAG